MFLNRGLPNIFHIKIIKCNLNGKPFTMRYHIFVAMHIFKGADLNGKIQRMNLKEIK